MNELIKCSKCQEEKATHLIKYTEDKTPICIFCAEKAGYNI